MYIDGVILTKKAQMFESTDFSQWCESYERMQFFIYNTVWSVFNDLNKKNEKPELKIERGVFCQKRTFDSRSFSMSKEFIEYAFNRKSYIISNQVSRRFEINKYQHNEQNNLRHYCVTKVLSLMFPGSKFIAIINNFHITCNTAGAIRDIIHSRNH